MKDTHTFRGVDKLNDEIDFLREQLAEIREIWAGAECGEPIYAQEAYAVRLCKQMYSVAVEALNTTEKRRLS